MSWALRRAERALTPVLREQLQGLELADAGCGWDALGAHPDWIRLGVAVTAPFYEHYFRVDSRGVEHVPRSGPAILVANHSGTLPYDATMLWADVIRNTRPPRLLRVVSDHFVPLLPFVNTVFSRWGVVGGSRANVEYLLDCGELLLIFPEGTGGVGKPFRARYQLQSWRVGHVQLAIRHRAPVVPVAVIGAEEQMPQLGRITRGMGRLGIPYLPLAFPPGLPLPVHYHLWYGPALDFSGRFAPQDADRPDLVRRAADEVRDAVASLIERGLQNRQGVFR